MEEEEETDEEKFVELWPAIRTCPYRCLVLPPECKRVPANQMLQQQRKMESSKKPEKKQEELDEDHPITRLRIYCENFLDLIRSILSYEYWNAAMTLLRWLTACIRLRRRHHDDSEEEEEEEEDDASRSSIATNREHSNSPLFRSPVTANDTANSVYIEEKKDMHDASHEHERSNASIYEVPLKDLGESALDEKDEPVPLPPSIPRLTSQKKGGVLKRKDALESYRGTLSSQGIMGQPTPLSPRPPPPAPLTLSADDLRNFCRRIIPEMSQNTACPTLTLLTLEMFLRKCRLLYLYRTEMGTSLVMSFFQTLDIHRCWCLSTQGLVRNKVNYLLLNSEDY